MKVVAIIEARMTSTRLPGKVMLHSLGMSMLERLVLRLRSVSNIDEVIVATTTNPEDDTIVNLCNSLSIRSFRGSELNVFERVIAAGHFSCADVVVEITGDCPLIDPRLVEKAVDSFLQTNPDYLSNCEKQTFPAGMEIQVVKLSSLIKSYSMTTSELDREHVTLHIRMNPEVFEQIHLKAPPELYAPQFSVTLDEYPDYELINFVIESLEPNGFYFGCDSIIELLRENATKAMVNSDVKRKGDT
jgi:spore coat polysaccharide biosynthesis protein SpsF